MAEPDPTAGRVVDFHTAGPWPQILSEVGAAVLVSTYQAGHLLAISAAPDQPSGVELSAHQLQRAMGIAVGSDRIAAAGNDQVWFLHEPAGLAQHLDPPGRYDRAFVPRESRCTGPAQIHELAWGAGSTPEGSDLWAVSTGFNCLVGLDERYSFVPRWRPPFIDVVVAEDRCHLNGMAMRAGRPAFVTVMARTNTAGGWRSDRNATGTILHVPSGDVVTTGLSMPHSPRWRDERSGEPGGLFVLNSGWGRLERVDLATGRREVVATVPGYARGLAFAGRYAFVGLSRIRETSTFGGTPLAPHHDQLICGIGVIDMTTGTTVATLTFPSEVEEIFDIQMLPDTRAVNLGSTTATGEQIWLLPASP